MDRTYRISKIEFKDCRGEFALNPVNPVYLVLAPVWRSKVVRA
jgi:hypothetical protein